MELRDLGPDSQPALEQTLGYLNFSSGAPDTLFLGHLNRLFAEIREQRDRGEKKSSSAQKLAIWQILGQLWQSEPDMKNTDAAVRDDEL